MPKKHFLQELAADKLTEQDKREIKIVNAILGEQPFEPIPAVNALSELGLAAPVAKKAEEIYFSKPLVPHRNLYILESEVALSQLRDAKIPLPENATAGGLHVEIKDLQRQEITQNSLHYQTTGMQQRYTAQGTRAFQEFAGNLRYAVTVGGVEGEINELPENTRYERSISSHAIGKGYKTIIADKKFANPNGVDMPTEIGAMEAELRREGDALSVSIKHRGSLELPDKQYEVNLSTGEVKTIVNNKAADVQIIDKNHPFAKLLADSGISGENASIPYKAKLSAASR